MSTAPDTRDQPRLADGAGVGAGLIGRARALAWLGGAGIALVVAAAVLLFLLDSVDAWRQLGLDVLFESRWQPGEQVLGIAAAVAGSLQVAVIALVLGLPVALAAALFVTEYAPRRIRSAVTTLIRVFAMVPSVVYGAWALIALQPRAVEIARWAGQRLGWIPVFHADTDPNAPTWDRASFTASVLVIGLAVAAMIIPTACVRFVATFHRTSATDRDAARALGATRAGVIRAVVLPVNRRAIGGAALAASGRALGDAVVVALLAGPVFDLHLSAVVSGTTTLPALIAERVGAATGTERSVLFVAAVVLLVVTFVVGVNATVLADEPEQPT